jgi:hypothetical protein
MRFSFRRISLVLASTALIFFGSCDKHHVGEWPEVQKEHVDLAGETKAASEPAASATPETTPTPAEFFPTSSPP